MPHRTSAVVPRYHTLKEKWKRKTEKIHEQVGAWKYQHPECPRGSEFEFPSLNKLKLHIIRSARQLRTGQHEVNILREGWLEDSFYVNQNQPPEGYRSKQRSYQETAREKFKGLDLPRPEPAGAILQSPQVLKSLNGQPNDSYFFERVNQV
ncbi:hypothetical protein HYFRA_00009114 [Hymenoscyphus fraxineus]|uniref:Uncharacterized protein n=1 Tax=Hymenoscyphus fraxineus TaxID=746836 RepID=A0A9N9KU90_9HELO|nr:hypothetical protein HYFRA_00009114 [Hymenoscyphus fraxineus]